MDWKTQYCQSSPSWYIDLKQPQSKSLFLGYKLTNRFQHLYGNIKNLDYPKQSWKTRKVKGSTLPYLKVCYKSTVC